MVQGPRHFCLTQDPLYKAFALEFPQGLVKSEVKLLVAQSCPTPCDPKDCGLCPWNSPGKNTEVMAVPFSRGIRTQGSETVRSVLLSPNLFFPFIGMMSLYIFCIPNPVSALNWHSWYQSGPEIMGSKTALWGLGHKLPSGPIPADRPYIHSSWHEAV